MQCIKGLVATTNYPHSANISQCTTRTIAYSEWAGYSHARSHGTFHGVDTVWIGGHYTPAQREICRMHTTYIHTYIHTALVCVNGTVASFTVQSLGVHFIISTELAIARRDGRNTSLILQTS